MNFDYLRRVFPTYFCDEKKPIINIPNINNPNLQLKPKQAITPTLPNAVENNKLPECVDNVYVPDFYTNFFMENIDNERLNTYDMDIVVSGKYDYSDKISFSCRHKFSERVFWGIADYKTKNFSQRVIGSSKGNILTNTKINLSDSISTMIVGRLSNLDKNMKEILDSRYMRIFLNYRQPNYSAQFIAFNTNLFHITGLYSISKNWTIGGELITFYKANSKKTMPLISSCGLSYQDHHMRILGSFTSEGVILLQYLQRLSPNSTLFTNFGTDLNDKKNVRYSAGYKYKFPLSNASVQCNVDSELEVKTVVKEQVTENSIIELSGKGLLKKGIYIFGIMINYNDAQLLKSNYSPLLGYQEC